MQDVQKIAVFVTLIIFAIEENNLGIAMIV
jgi:hypothetical protein